MQRGIILANLSEPCKLLQLFKLANGHMICSYFTASTIPVITNFVIDRVRLIFPMCISFSMCSQVQCLVAVLHLQTFRLMQPIFRFPNHVKFKRINMHVHTHVIFVYGSQVRHQNLKKHESAVGSKEASTSL